MQGIGFNMRAFMKPALAALLMLPLLSFATVAHLGESTSTATPLLAWALGPWACVLGAAALLLGAITGLGPSPWPALEGVALAAGLNWWPSMFTDSSPFAQSGLVLVLVVWMATFVWMNVRWHLAGIRGWDRFSFLELFGQLKRLKGRAGN